MLSHFIWRARGGKGKGSKANDSRSQQKSTSAHSSIVSPLVFDIHDSVSLSNTQSPLLVKLNLSGSDEEWFPKELLRSRSCSQSSLLRTQNAKAAENNSICAKSPPTPPPNCSDDSPSRAAARKRSIPAPILIPNAESHVPNIQIGHSAVFTAAPVPKTSQPVIDDAPLNPPSPSASDNLSSISGTTLARALMASTFVLSSNERRSSRRQSIVRQDSATLPRRESVFQLDSGMSSSIPPVPPLPTTLAGVPSNPNHTSPIKSGASTESEYPMSDSSMTSPEIAIPPPPAVSDTVLKEKTSPVPTCTRAVKNDVFDGPMTAVEPPLPVNAQATTRRLSQEGSSVLSSDDHSLDEFDFVPPEPPIVIASPGSDSSASYSAPLPKRNDAKWRRRLGGTNFVRIGANDNSDGILASQQDHSIPSASVSENDYGELLNYDLTVSPGSNSSWQMLSSASAGYQTFPETPMVFSPLCSPAYALLSKSDSQVLHTHPRSPKSAGLGSRKLFTGVCASRRQMDHRHGICGGIHKSRSSFSPKQEMVSPRQPKFNLIPAVQVTDEGVSDEMDQLSTKNTVESQNPVNIQVITHPRPLAHISTSSSCLPEGEALCALARCSASSLPSFAMDDVSVQPSLMPDRASVIDPSVEPPTVTPCPEPTNGLPSNSPALVDSATAASSPVTPLQSPLPSTTTAVSQPDPSKSSSSSESFPEESFLCSLPPPALSNAPPPGLLYPRLNAPSSAVSDVSISPSFFPPPPYHAVVLERTVYHPLPPFLSSTPPSDHDHRRNRYISSSSMASGSTRCRGRSRPTPPAGPRKPSGSGQLLGTFVPEVHGRSGSISSVGSGAFTGRSESPWRALQAAASMPPPKFQMPPPKWRGLTLEAAQWTFTSAQLQEVVSRAIQQSSEGSSIRVLRLEVLEGEVADEMHRLELQHTDLKAQYKALVRKRWTLMGTLASQIESVENNDASQTMEALVEVSLELDQIADRMHDTLLRMSQLKSLCDVHNASALALAVRKINGLFIRQVAEKERLQGRVDTLVTERDDAWKHAEDIARDYDALNKRVSETECASGDTNSKVDGDAQSSVRDANRRSMHISAVRKLNDRMSRAGLRSRRTSTRPSSLVVEDAIPPVPRLALKSPNGPPLSMGVISGSTCSYESGTSEAAALAIAQREVYEMLGLSVPPSQASSRYRTFSVPEERMSMLVRGMPLHALGARVRPRSVSESFHIHTHTQAREQSFQESGRATRSVVFERPHSPSPRDRTMDQ